MARTPTTVSGAHAARLGGPDPDLHPWKPNGGARQATEPIGPPQHESASTSSPPARRRPVRASSGSGGSRSGFGNP